MPLATEEEWESDPELRQMRKDFVASFTERRLAIESFLPSLKGGGQAADGAVRGAVQGVLKVAHKLAGAAETYGFPTLTRAAAAFEDWAGSAGADGARAWVFASLLAEMLAGAQAIGKDNEKQASDPRFVQLLAAAQEK